MKAVLSGLPKPTGPALVGINLTTAGHLAAALDRRARALRAGAGRARAAAVIAGVVPVAAVALDDVAAWAEAEARALRSVVERLGTGGVNGVARWRGAGPAFADPARAHAVAQEVLAALAAGRLDEAGRLLGHHRGDPVLATTVVNGLGAAGIVALLTPAWRTWASDLGSAPVARAAVLAVADALALASRHGTETVAMGDLVRAADRAGVPVAALGLLFAGGASFAPEVLRQAVAAIVVPINAGLREQPGVGPAAWLLPAAGHPLDARVLVLGAVARDRQASVEVVGATDLDDLLPASLAYLDGGVALSRVLLAATAPLDPGGRVVADPLTTTSAVAPGREGENARRVIEWIGRHREAPLGVQVVLGDLARPWIGSFRAPGLDSVVPRHLPLDEGAARGYLAYAHARRSAAADLQDGAWTWAAAEVDHLARPGASGGGFDAVGSVLGLVTRARLDVAAVAAAEADEQAARRNRLWRRAVGLVVGRVPPALRPAVDPLVERGLRDALARTDGELAHWRDERDPAVLHEALALDYLVASALWAHRDDRHLLDRPPPELLVDPARPRLGLRPLPTLDEAGAVAWARWRSASAAGGPAPMQLAGDRFLLETRRD